MCIYWASVRLFRWLGGQDFNPELETVAEEEFPNYRLAKVMYQTLPHLTVLAYLLRPKGNDRPRPAVLCHLDMGKELIK